jgi:hypothetical protein
MRNFHVTSQTADLNTLARHEAGHLLMLWLLDCNAAGCIIAEGGGLVMPVAEPGKHEMSHMRILRYMAGMVLADQHDVFNRLHQHATEPDYFTPLCDSHHIADALRGVNGDPNVRLNQYRDIILSLGSRFRKAHIQATKLILEQQIIVLDAIYELFGQWTAEYDQSIQPNSDVVCRAIARAFRWPMPRGKFIGWDFKPLPEGFVAPKRAELRELMERVREQFQSLKSEPAG